MIALIELMVYPFVLGVLIGIALGAAGALVFRK